MAQGQADVIPAIEHALLAEGINLEADRMTVGPHDQLRRQVDGQAIARRMLGEGRMIGSRPFLKQLL